MNSPADILKKLSEDGATFVEDFMILAAIVLPLAIIGNYLIEAMGIYFESLAVVVSLPFP